MCYATEDDDDDGLASFDGTSVETPPMMPEQASPQPEVSLNSVMGLTSPKTLKMSDTIRGECVVVMIDPGATQFYLEGGVGKSCVTHSSD